MAEGNPTENPYEVSYCCNTEGIHIPAPAPEGDEQLHSSAYTLMNGTPSPADDGYTFAAQILSGQGQISSSNPERSVGALPGISARGNQATETDLSRAVYSTVGARSKNVNPYAFAHDVAGTGNTEEIIRENQGDGAFLTTPATPVMSEMYAIRQRCSRDILVCCAITIAILASVLALILSSQSLSKVHELHNHLSSTSRFELTTPVTTLSSEDRCSSGRHECHPDGGVCVNTNLGYGCFCRDGWLGNGKNCSEKIYKTCEELRTVKGFNTGYYKISPEPEKLEPVVVRCVMERDKGVTEFDHDSEAEMLVNGCDGAGCYFRNITYRDDMNFITAVIEASTTCVQYIKYRCYHSAIRDGDIQMAWWVSRLGTNETRWGGAVRDQSCACSNENNTTCPGCNCNINDSTWREDDGFIANKTLLPVIQLRFGDAVDIWEEGYHTLGKLRCYG